MDSEQANSSSTDNQPNLDDINIPIPPTLKFMMEGLKIISQSPLTLDNHLIWSTQISNLFLANGYSKYLDINTPTPPPFLPHQDGNKIPNPAFPKWQLINRNLMVATMATISSPIQPFVHRCSTIAHIWSTLKTQFQSQSRAKLIQLKEELHRLSMQGKTMSQYLHHAKSILDNLEAAGTHIDEEDVMIYIMNGLPDSYDGFKVAFRLHREPTPINEFYSTLLTEEANILKKSNPEPISTSHALAAAHSRAPHGRPPPPTSSNRDKYPPPHSRPKDRSRNPSYHGSDKSRARVECQICKKLGHTADKCWFRHHDSSPSHSKAAYLTDSHSSKDSHASGSTPPTAPDDWYLDSGASANLTNQFQISKCPPPTKATIPSP